MSQWTTWFAMGGYAGYVWSAYGLVLVVMVGTLIGTAWQRKRTLKKLDQWFRQ